MTITIIGLGPGDPQLITRRAWQLLSTAPQVWVRTRRHPAVVALDGHTQVASYDHLYEQQPNFEAVYNAIAADVVARGAGQDVIYAVPGDPTVAETSTRIIRRLATAQGVELRIEPGVSFLEPTFAALAADPIDGIQIIDALALAQAHHPPGASEQGLLAVQLFSRELASDVKLTLMNAYPDDHPLILVSGAGTDNLALHPLPLYELDRKDIFDDHTTLWAPPLPQPGSYEALQEIIAHLRSPEGCPWDREQTHLSLRPYLLEEAHEVLEALDADDAESLVEELGDLLIQVALHVQIAAEEGEFKLPDVIGHVVAKLVRRHPHVFDGLQVAGAAEVVRNWEAIKQAERRQAAGNGGKKDHKTLLDGIPRSLPALALAQAYVERLARVGYPVPPAAPLDEAGLAGRLLQLVEQAQAAGLDAESALRSICAGLRVRLAAVEAAAGRAEQTLLDLPPEQQQALWRQHPLSKD
jgi:tetrapyrrole methylase family protein/MazG family protein